jgi:NADH-quinone oxidoreductase subunit F
MLADFTRRDTRDAAPPNLRIIPGLESVAERVRDVREAEAILERLAVSGLRGRGGGWFPTALKWRAVRAEGGDPVVIANGAEGEPGSVKDRHVMMSRPAAVLEGLAIAATAVGAREGIVFLKASFDRPAAALARAIEDGAAGALRVTIARGDDSYVTGEETALLEALEGRRPWPRPKPPLPSAAGLYGRPTLVQNVETLSRVGAAVANPELYRRAETTLVSLWGHVARPGVYEVPLGTPLTTIVEERGQGAPTGIGMIFPAGPSAPPLTAAQAGTTLHPDALRATGSALGTASVLVIGEAVCPIAVGASLAGFFERESCGQCPPCTVGSASLARAMRAVEAGAARASDINALAEVAGFMKDHGYCAHSRTAAAAVTGLLARFPADVEAHLSGGRCPRPGAPACDPFAAVSPEWQAIEARV